jgi:hypothetical protein
MTFLCFTGRSGMLYGLLVIINYYRRAYHHWRLTDHTPSLFLKKDKTVVDLLHREELHTDHSLLLLPALPPRIDRNPARGISRVGYIILSLRNVLRKQ